MTDIELLEAQPEPVDYFVAIDNEESNEEADNLSITGRVNGIQCAAVIKLSTVNNLRNRKSQKLAKQRALIMNLQEKQSSVSEAMGDKVTL